MSLAPNILTFRYDKAPLITLFGERLTKQFLSESISFLDNLIFALSPLGVITAVVSVIRVCGGSSLRAFIGRAQEGPAEAESELLSCVSESTAELFNEGGISRVFGRPKIVEIVMWENEDPQDAGKSTEIGTLRDALKKEAWFALGSNFSKEKLHDPTYLPELEVPNLSLNKGIKRLDQFWFHCVAVVGVVMQIGVVIYAALTVFIFPGSFEKDGKAVPSYAFPFYMIGTIFLFIGMLACAIVIERSSEEYYFKPNKPSKIFWLQPGKQHVGDQVFNAFMAAREGSKSTMTMEMEYIKSARARKYDGRHVEIYMTLLSTLLGFVFQFIGLRGLHASVILAQLGSTFVMSILRTCLRTERMPEDGNKMRGERELTSHKQQELDCFAFHLENFKSFQVIPPSPPVTSSTESSSDIDQTEVSLVSQLIQTRARLAELTASASCGLMVEWDNIPIRKMAQHLALVIESTMDLMSSWGVDLGKSFKFPLNIEFQPSNAECDSRIRTNYTIVARRCGDALRWSLDKNELEAVLGLWVWSLIKSDEDWHQPLNRMIGLTAEEAGEEETYFLFHKWIFRQTEARLVSSKMIDPSRRLFGIESEDQLHDKEILIVRTDNAIEIMAAQDLYIRFLQVAFGYLIKLDGKNFLSTESQNTVFAHNSRVDELVQCFENCQMGSREDALLCIVPVLKAQHILPEFAADSPTVKRHIESLVAKRDWKQALYIGQWMCERCEGAEFERSVYELGYLCRRALLSNDKMAEKDGFSYICSALKSDIRTDFLQSQTIAPPPSWSRSPEYQQWWRSFSTQMGWVTEHIITNVLGLRWMQPSLKQYNSSRGFEMPEVRHMDPERARIGARAMREWLTLGHIDFMRDFDGNDDELCFEWALKGRHYALLYFILVRWAELGTDHPMLTRHAYTIAARHRSSWGVQILQRQGADIENLTHSKMSILVEIMGTGDIEATKTLLDNGANPNGSDDAPEQRPLLMAARAGLTNMVELLLHYGASLEILDSAGLSALHWASKADHLETTKLLLSRGAEVDRFGSDERTALHSAVLADQLLMVELLIDNGADVNIPEGIHGQTPLILAAMSSFDDIVRLLLSKGASLQYRDHGGLTALDWARRNDYRGITTALEASMRQTTTSRETSQTRVG
ncbi:Fibronectin type 3 and ankyrin repeat domains protein 1 [Penicillium rolfsii]|nr:Fibronectin type 3 and ankyrin repeat domains protein 1 [Penicillium rolfsii]